jgi:hypothetical protein
VIRRKYFSKRYAGETIIFKAIQEEIWFKIPVMNYTHEDVKNDAL